MLLTIDMRKAQDTGIGTYIRNVVPRVVRAWPVGHVQALVTPGDARTKALLSGLDVRTIEFGARPFSLAEQWLLRPFASSDRLLWATSVAHPLFTTGRFVCTVHDLAQLALPRELGATRRHRLLARAAFESIRRRADQVIHVSNFTASEFRRLVGTPRGTETVTPLGVDQRTFAQTPPLLTSPLPGPYFLMVGNLRPHKNLRLVLQALEHAGSALPHRLLLIGPEQTAATLEPLCRHQEATAKRLVLAGSVSPDGLRAAFAHAEALLFPSHYEGFGLPVLEAMAGACPVIVARNGVSAELAGTQALNFDPCDARELAQAMISQVAKSGLERRAQIQAGLNRASAASWDHTAELTLAALVAATGRRRSPQTGTLAA